MWTDVPLIPSHQYSIISGPPVQYSRLIPSYPDSHPRLHDASIPPSHSGDLPATISEFGDLGRGIDVASVAQHAVPPLPSSGRARMDI